MESNQLEWKSAYFIQCFKRIEIFFGPGKIGAQGDRVPVNIRSFN